MFDQTLVGVFRRTFQSIVGQIMALALAMTLLVLPALAQSANPSGLPLPRFASTRSDPVNIRVGPGTKYEVAWTYLKSDLPVEIVQEFDTWRKIRDVDGSEGWVHQNLLSGTRVGYAKPLQANGEVALRANPSDAAALRARLEAGFKVTIKECNGDWCEVTATTQDASQRSANYSGFMHQEEIWGVYPDESFD